MQELSDGIEKLRCFQDPRTELVPMKTRYLSDAIDVMPAAALFSAQVALDESMPEWRTALGDLLEMMPIEPIANLCSFADDVGESFEITRCEVLRDIEPRKLTRVERASKLQAKLLSIIIPHLKDDWFVTGVGVVGGGGGAGANARNRVKSLLKGLQLVLANLPTVIKEIDAERNVCVAADDRMERDLLSCTALASYESKFLTVRHLALRRVDTLYATMDEIDDIHEAADFLDLCEAYQEIRYD